MNNDIFDRAVNFALEAHRGQLRKDGGIYILHPLEDATIVGSMTNDPEVLAAAVLHDTLEDTDTTPDELLEAFGERVAMLVEHETEDKRPHMSKSASWKIRKEESLELLKNSDDINVKILWLGDKLSNIRSLYRGYKKRGVAIFDQFNESDPKQQRWYHETIISYLTELEGCEAYEEYKSIFHKIFDDFE